MKESEYIAATNHTKLMAARVLLVDFLAMTPDEREGIRAIIQDIETMDEGLRFVVKADQP